MVSLSFLAPSNIALTLTILLGMAEHCKAAVECDVINSDHCGRNSHHIAHKLPTNVGATFFVNGFHGGVMNAKFESKRQSVPGFNSNSDNIDLTYNFNLGDYDGTYWVILPTGFDNSVTCYAVYKNCDVHVTFWETKTPLPDLYTLA
ncbi:hypothetical protein FZEAL_9033 [Fusarium zealandicum]|uniref:Uncharacterized protein n=1 Tax=Fusarium zealandicum TaxID=1053134 RepID=A0A8H4UCP8_9HYPO|nr:hypothetical protein FZEAL_9033 [Fusarium zealandicum]